MQKLTFKKLGHPTEIEKYDSEFGKKLQNI